MVLSSVSELPRPAAQTPPPLPQSMETPAPGPYGGWSYTWPWSLNLTLPLQCGLGERRWPCLILSFLLCQMKSVLFLRENAQKPITRPRAGDEWLHIMQVHCQEGSSSLSGCPWTVICALRDDKYSNRCGLPETKQADPNIKKSWEVGEGVWEAGEVITAAAFWFLLKPLKAALSAVNGPPGKVTTDGPAQGLSAGHARAPPPHLATWCWWLLFLHSRPCSHPAGMHGTEKQAPSPWPWGLRATGWRGDSSKWGVGVPGQRWVADNPAQSPGWGPKGLRVWRVRDCTYSRWSFRDFPGRVQWLRLLLPVPGVRV